MQLACSTFPFDGLPLAETYVRIRELGFRFVDLVLSDDPRWGHVSPTTVQKQPLAALEEVGEAERRSGIGTLAFNVTLNPASHAERGQFEAVCRLARGLGVRLVSLGAGRGDELGELRRLRDYAALAGECGVQLAVETLYPSLFQEPGAAARLVASMPGVRVTLDTGHLLQQNIPVDRWAPLYPLVAHVHVRDAGPTIPRHQVPLGQGGLRLGALLAGLRGAGYVGALTVEYLGQRTDNAVEFDAETEIVRLRKALEADLLSGG